MFETGLLPSLSSLPKGFLLRNPYRGTKIPGTDPDIGVEGLTRGRGCEVRSPIHFKIVTRPPVGNGGGVGRSGGGGPDLEKSSSPLIGKTNFHCRSGDVLQLFLGGC